MYEEGYLLPLRWGEYIEPALERMAANTPKQTFYRCSGRSFTSMIDHPLHAA